MVCTGMLLLPDAWYPVMDAAEGVAVQLNVVPATFESKFTLDVFDPEQIDCAIDALVMDGKGLMVTR